MNNLASLLKHIPHLEVQDNWADINFYHLCLNSQQLSQGDVFVALPGQNCHGLDFVAEAIKQGAVAILSDRTYRPIHLKKPAIAIIVIDNLVQHLPVLAAATYPLSSRTNIIGITGTNGKTTIAFFLMQLLYHLNYEVISIGTLGVWHINQHQQLARLCKIEDTTPDIFTLHRLISEFGNQKYVVLEVTSHALVQKRLGRLIVDSAIFSNLSQDHLDYHHSMANYRQAKQQLFTIPELKRAIINLDDPYAKKLYSITCAKTICTYGIKNHRQQNHTGISELSVKKGGFSGRINNLPFKLNLLGIFNIYNALASVSYLLSLGISIKIIVPLLAIIQAPRGRMHKIGTQQIWVDFAHTPDALKNAISTLKIHYPQQKVVVLFGCGGNRDKYKRAKMGRIADHLAHKIILTNDNVRYEQPLMIINAIKQGIKKQTPLIIINRKTAIQEAITGLQADECLLIAGKGHEDTQQIKGDKFLFSDIEIAQQMVNNVC